MEQQLKLIEEAIQVVYSAGITNEQRIAASKVLEAAKELAPYELKQIAHALISTKDLIVACVGWHFLEDIIKFKWLEMDATFRLSMRTICFAVMRTEDMLQRELRSAAARCVVLMIEHEWPQNWPELFDQLQDIASISTIHAQVPFIILQHLIQNVVTMATIENSSRKKDLNNAIISNLPRILHMIYFTLCECSVSGTEQSYLLASSALDLFSELAEWIPARILEPHLNNLLCIICSLLTTAQNSIYEQAANCLWRLASRKRAKNEESVVVLALFSDVPMQSLLTAASTSASVGANDLEHYRFLKVLCNVLSSLGIHLADVWTERPPNFAIYLAAIEAFLKHPSVYLRNEAATVSVSLVNLEQIRDDEIFNEFTCRVIFSIPSLLEKTGYPSMNDCESCRFSQYDYDDDNEFLHEFTQFRDRCLKFIRASCTERHANLLVSIVENWLSNRCLGCPSLVKETEWDAMQRFSKLVLSACHHRKLLKPDDYGRLSLLFEGILTLVSNCTSPSIFNNLLSLLSALLIVIGNHPNLLPPLLLQLRRPLSDCTDDNIDEKSVKRHCIALLLKLVTSFADEVKAQAEVILNFCLSICPGLSLMQFAACMQVVAALSNLCVDFASQCSFLNSALSSTVDYFLQAVVQNAVQSDSGFLQYFGFTSPAPANNDEASKSPFMLNRRAFLAHLTAVEGIMAYTQSVSLPAHPAYDAIRPILPILFSLVKRLASLYDPRNRAMLHDSYVASSVFDITAGERQQLLLAVDSCALPTARKLSDDPGTHARAFIFDITEKVQVLIGHFASKAAVQLFSDPQIDSWIFDLSSHLSYIPDYRLRFWLRRAWKPFLCSCPEVTFHSIRQMLLTVVDELHRRLENCWEQLAVQSIDEESSQEQLLAEHLACILTRECVVFLRSLFGISDSGEKSDEISSLKIYLLNDLEITEKVVALMFLCLTCRDTTAAIRVISVCRNATECLAEKSGEEMAFFMLVRSIQSLQIHGSDELALSYILSLVFFIYSSLRGRFPRLSHIFEQVPQCSVEDVEKLNHRIASLKCGKDGANEKVKRELMKKLLQAIIPTTLGKQYRKPVHLRVLTPLKKNKELAEDDFTALNLIFNDV